MDSTMEQFTNEVREMVRIQNQMRLITKESSLARKELKPAFDSLEESVITFMSTQGLDSVLLGEEKIELRTTQRPAPLNRTSLMPVLESYFGNEVEAQRMMDFINDELGLVEKDVLRRIKQKPAKRAPRKKTPVKQAQNEENEVEMIE